MPQANFKTTFVTVTVGAHTFRVAGHKTGRGNWHVELVRVQPWIPKGGAALMNRRIIDELEAQLGIPVTPKDLFRAGLVE
jgi:hypothetical protein